MKLTKNFSKSEFDCKCGCEMPEDVLENVQNLAKQLQVIRTLVGKSITINSGYRCPEHNASPSVGGSKKSQHIKGKASDIVIKDMNPDDVVHLVEQLIDAGHIDIGGVGMYNTFTHIDTRKNKARWNFKND